MKNLPLTNDGFAIVDDDIYERAKDFKWYLDHHGYPNSNGKTRAKINRGWLHKFVLGSAPKPLVTDHINRNKLDNRRENLRFVNRRINNLNSSKKKWIIRHQNKWRVRFHIGELEISIVGIQTEEAARSIAALLKGSLIYYELTKGG